MSIRGWVYVITNKAMPGLVKVGYSTKDPQLRAAELGGTGSPYPYEVEFDILVYEPREVEKCVHRALAEFREGKEWFRLTPHAAAVEIRKHAAPVANSSMPDQPLGLMGTKGEKCQFSPDCHTPSTQSFRGMAFCDAHYDRYTKGWRAAVRRGAFGKPR